MFFDLSPSLQVQPTRNNKEAMDGFCATGQPLRLTWELTQNAGCLVYVGDFSTQLQNKPLQGSHRIPIN